MLGEYATIYVDRNRGYRIKQVILGPRMISEKGWEVYRKMWNNHIIIHIIELYE